MCVRDSKKVNVTNLKSQNRIRADPVLAVWSECSLEPKRFQRTFPEGAELSSVPGSGLRSCNSKIRRWEREQKLA